MIIYKDESLVANEILDGRIPAWLVAVWDKVYKTDSINAARILLRSQTWSYRLKRWLLHGLILTVSICLFTEAMYQRESADTSVIDLLFFRTSLWFGVGAIGFLFITGAFFGEILTAMRSPRWQMHPLLLSYCGLKCYWDHFPSTKEAARRLADEHIIALAVTVLQRQKCLIVDSTFPAERQRQIDATERQLVEEAKRMEELSSTFDFFKDLGLVTVGKGGGYGGHFAQAKKRLAAASNDAA